MLFGYTWIDLKMILNVYSTALDIILIYISHLWTAYIGVVGKLLFINIFLKKALGMFV